MLPGDRITAPGFNTADCLILPYSYYSTFLTGFKTADCLTLPYSYYATLFTGLLVLLLLRFTNCATLT